MDVQEAAPTAPLTESDLLEWELRAHAQETWTSGEVLRLIAEVRRLREEAGRGAPVPTPAERKAAAERLRQMVESARAGDGRIDSAAVQREAAVLRAGVTVMPGKRDDDLEWRQQFQSLLDQIRSGVPEEWSEEEIMQRVEQTVKDVRAGRARRR